MYQVQMSEDQAWANYGLGVICMLNQCFKSHFSKEGAKNSGDLMSNFGDIFGHITDIKALFLHNPYIFALNTSSICS